MSYVLRHNGNADYADKTPLDEHCLCAQMAPGWCEPGADPAALRAHANPGCAFCGGTGLEARPYRAQRGELHLAEANASALFALLCLDKREGRASIATMRSALALARMTPKRRAKAERPAEVGVGAGGCRWMSCGLDADRIVGYLDSLEAMVKRAEEKCATAIVWE